MPQTPRFAGVSIAGGADRARRRRQAKRARAHREQLQKSGLLPTRPSRSARAKARELREKAGGVTEFSLYTPLGFPANSQTQRGEVRDALDRGTASRHADWERSDKVLRTESWVAIAERLRDYRYQLRQVDGSHGDIGLRDEEAVNADDEGHPRRKRRDRPRHHHQHHREDRKHAHFSDGNPVESLADALDFDEDGDLALPPPALDLDAPAAPMSKLHSDRIVVRDEQDSQDDHLGSERESSTKDRLRLGQLGQIIDAERATGWHMSDVPLTPKTTGAAKRGPASDQSEQRPRPRKSASTRAPSARATQSAVGQSRKEPPEPPRQAPPQGGSARPQSAWWLDISCPTYRDMAELSRLFPLHPLTVEDILQQESREKVEVFAKLGYYFAIVRSIDERYFKYSSSTSQNHESPRFSPNTGHAQSPTSNEATSGSTNTLLNSQKSEGSEGKGSPPFSDGLRRRHKPRNEVDSTEMQEIKPEPGLLKQLAASGRAERKVHHELPSGKRHGGRVDIIEGAGGKEGLEGLSVGACNMYLVVFAHGVISFHSEDVSKHTDRVRRRILDPAHTVDFTSDWIFHGLLDSVVDSFFPQVEFVEAEVGDIEVETSEEKVMSGLIDEASHKLRGLSGLSQNGQAMPLPGMLGEGSRSLLVLRVAPCVPLPARFARMLPKLLVKERLSAVHAGEKQRFWRKGHARREAQARIRNVSAEQQTAMLRRISDIRKIVHGLSRLLLPKNDTIRGVRKRLTGLRSLTPAGEEVSVHMGDVGDHVVSLLSLLHAGEMRLNETYQNYLVSVRINNRRSKLHTDEALVVFGSVTVTAFACFAWLALWGMNVHLPGNIEESPVHHWWIGVVCGLFLIPVLVFIYIRLARRAVDKKWKERRVAR